MSAFTYVFFVGSCSVGCWTDQSVWTWIWNIRCDFYVCVDVYSCAMRMLKCCFFFKTGSPSEAWLWMITLSANKGGTTKGGVTQHEPHRNVDSAGDNDRKDGRERGDDMQPEVAGRPQLIAYWVWGMSSCWLNFRAPSWNNLQWL